VVIDFHEEVRRIDVRSGFAVKQSNVDGSSTLRTRYRAEHGHAGKPRQGSDGPHSQIPHP
jgi:hypothetical protein